MKNRHTEFTLIENHFSPIYLTVIALIQGIALSMLAVKFVDAINAESIFWERYIISGMIILVVWHHYMYGIIYLRWFPGIADTLLPLSLGASQFVNAGMIQNNEPYQWLIFLSVFFLFGGLAYINSAIRTKPELFASHYENEISTKYSRYIGKCHWLAGITCFIQAILVILIAFKKLPYSYIHLVVIILSAHIIVYEAFYLKKIKPCFISMIQSKKGGGRLAPPTPTSCDVTNSNRA